MIYTASESEFARKNIHAKQTRLKVAKILIPLATWGCRENGNCRELFLRFHKTELTIKTPCNAPQMMNVQSVPCQSPLASIVNMGGSASTRRLSELSLLRLNTRLSG